MPVAAGDGDGLDCCPRAANGFNTIKHAASAHNVSVSFSFSIHIESQILSAPGRRAKIHHPLPPSDFIRISLLTTKLIPLSRVRPGLFFGVTGLAGTDGSLGIRIFFVAICFVAFNAARFDLRVRASGNAVIGILNIYAAAFGICIRVSEFLVTGDAPEHGFDARIFVRVMAILAALRIRRFDVIAVIEIFDHTPFVVLSPMRTFFRIAQTNDPARRGFCRSRCCRCRLRRSRHRRRRRFGWNRRCRRWSRRSGRLLRHRGLC